MAFHPTRPILATTVGTHGDQVIRIWAYDERGLLGLSRATDGRAYKNAKVVLVGDTGVGKSGLALVLTGQPFTPTDSTHGRHVWTLESTEVALPNGRTETRERRCSGTSRGSQATASSISYIRTRRP